MSGHVCGAGFGCTCTVVDDLQAELEENTGVINALRRHRDTAEATNRQLLGVVWWLASELSADDDSSTLTWVELAERHWRLGLRFEQRPLRFDGQREASS